MDWNLDPDLLSSTWLERGEAFVSVVLLTLATWAITRWLGKRLRGSTRMGLRHLERLAAPFSLLALGLGTSFILFPLTDEPPIFQWAVELLLVVSGFWLMGRALDVALATAQRSARIRDDLVSDAALVLTHHILKAAVYLGLLVSIAVHLGVTEQLYLVLGALGAALVFAARDPIRNAFAFALLVIDPPFQMGDWVVIGDFRGGSDVRGKVMDINLASTTIRTRQRTLVSLPHANLLQLRVENLSASSRRRLVLSLPIPSRMTAESVRNLCELIERAAIDNGHVSGRRRPRVWLSGLGEGLQLRISVWLKSRRNRREAQRDLLLLAKNQLEAHLRRAHARA